MKYIISLLFFIASFELIAQETFLTVNTESELTQAVSIIQDEFTAKLENNDHSLTKLFDKQIIYQNKDTFHIFLPTEKAMALFLFGKYFILLNDVLEKNDFHYNLQIADYKRKKVSYPHSNEALSVFWMNYKLLEKLKLKEKIIKSEIKNSLLKPDEKDFLCLYFESILSYNNLKLFDTELMNSRADTFLGTYQNSPYCEYVNKVLNIKLETMKYGIGCGAFIGYNVMNGNISKHFKNSIPIGVGLEFGYSRYFIKSEVAFSLSSYLKEPFVYKENIWTTDSTFSLISGNVNFAYALFDNSHFRISPYIGIGTHRINISEEIDNMHFKPNFNIGLDFDWKFSEVNSYKSYFDTFDAAKNYTYNYLRLRFGYSYFNNEENRFSGSLVYIKIEIGIFSNPAGKK